MNNKSSRVGELFVTPGGEFRTFYWEDVLFIEKTIGNLMNAN